MFVSIYDENTSVVQKFCSEPGLIVMINKSLKWGGQ